METVLQENEENKNNLINLIKKNTIINLQAEREPKKTIYDPMLECNYN